GFASRRIRHRGRSAGLALVIPTEIDGEEPASSTGWPLEISENPQREAMKSCPARRHCRACGKIRITRPIDAEATVKHVMMLIVVVAAAPAAGGQDADDYRGGWRTHNGSAGRFPDRG